MIRYPAPLRRGDLIGVTSASCGVPPELRARFEFALNELREASYEVVVGSCMDGTGVVSAPAEERAAELMGMMTDPSVRAVVPPWGGDLAVELLPLLDFEAIASAEPTWFVGMSDISTLLLSLTAITGMATVHGPNLFETPYRVPESMLSWTHVAAQPAGARLVQAPSERHRFDGFDDWVANPTVTEYTLDAPGTWRLLDPRRSGLQVRGRLLGGCIETISILAGTRYGDVRKFADTHAPEGLILYLEAAGDHNVVGIAQDLWRMRLAGWLDRASAVLVARTNLPTVNGFGIDDAVRGALAGIDIPIVMDVDCGHLPPHLALVNGALAELVINPTSSTLVQWLQE